MIRKKLTPFLNASLHGDLDEVQKMVEDNHNINETTNDGMNGLLLSIGMGNPENIKMNQFLLENGIDIHQRTRHQQTSLMLASFRGMKQQVEELLNYGADINAVDQDGWDALMYSCYNLPLLLNNVFIPMDIEEWYFKIMDNINQVYRKRREKDYLLERLDIINILLKNGINTNQLSTDIKFNMNGGSRFKQVSALDIYMSNVYTSNLKIIDTLLENGVKENYDISDYYSKNKEIYLTRIFEISTELTLKKKTKYLSKKLDTKMYN